MSNFKDFKNKNTQFSGVEGIDLPEGTTAQRSGSPDSGNLRFNTTTNLAEYYDGTDWKAIDSPPVVTNFTIAGGSDVTSSDIDNEAAGNVTIEIKGSLFDTTGAIVTFEGGSETLSTTTIVRNSSNLLTVTLPYANFDVANSPYTIKVTNASGLAATLAAAITADSVTPVFLNAADTTVVVFDGNRGSGIAAADLCGATGGTAYSITSGALPSGMTINSSTGAIEGTASAVGSDTTSTFTVQATGDELTATRQFKITIKSPTTVTYTSSGSYSFTAPSGVTTLSSLIMIGGGGGGTSGNGAWGNGGGGGGGIKATGVSVTPGSSYSLVVGGGGSGGTSCPGDGAAGGNTTAFSNTANGSSSSSPGGGNGGVGGSYTLSNGSDNGSGNGGDGGDAGGDGASFGGQNGLGSPYGSGAPGVPNYTEGPHASGYGNGGAGGPSCQNGHRGGGNGSGGYLQFIY